MENTAGECFPRAIETMRPTMLHAPSIRRVPLSSATSVEAKVYSHGQDLSMSRGQPQTVQVHHQAERMLRMLNTAASKTLTGLSMGCKTPIMHANTYNQHCESINTSCTGHVNRPVLMKHKARIVLIATKCHPFKAITNVAASGLHHDK